MPPEVHNENPEVAKPKAKAVEGTSESEHRERQDKAVENVLKGEATLAVGSEWLGKSRAELYKEFPKMASVMRQVDNFHKNPKDNPLPSKADLEAAFDAEREGNETIKNERLMQGAIDEAKGSCGTGEVEKSLSDVAHLYKDRLNRLLIIQNHMNRKE